MLPIVVQAIRGWWIWAFYLNPMTWTTYGLVASQLGDVQDTVPLPDGTQISIADKGVEFCECCEIAQIVRCAAKQGIQHAKIPECMDESHNFVTHHAASRIHNKTVPRTLTTNCTLNSTSARCGHQAISIQAHLSH